MYPLDFSTVSEQESNKVEKIIINNFFHNLFVLVKIILNLNLLNLNKKINYSA